LAESPRAAVEAVGKTEAEVEHGIERLLVDVDLGGGVDVDADVEVDVDVAVSPAPNPP
jgi:tetrahydromethanopterin S-methyltransferase subunit E